ncbi:hypothetical protein Glove_158g60 [Diversispora epigaea]|uniref:Uncharacterized protein n=1 Tax=Diversispora epigaea TaxID=1348612 RepID=A0A397IY45_9GLOM|nr:hypothetical protein Glove_158g60 [Diversispora epigaea]
MYDLTLAHPFPFSERRFFISNSGIKKTISMKYSNFVYSAQGKNVTTSSTYRQNVTFFKFRFLLPNQKQRTKKPPVILFCSKNKQSDFFFFRIIKFSKINNSL